MTRVLILAGESDLIARINVHPGTQVVTLPADTVESGRFDLMRSLDPQHLPDLVLCCELPTEISFALASAADEAYPSIDFVLVGDHPAEVAVEAMRAGMRDIVRPDLSDADLTHLLRKAEKRRVVDDVPALAVADTSKPLVSRVITVVSPKGGVGKTAIAANLALGLAEQHPMDVVLVDLDLQFGDVSSVLNLSPESTMEDALGPMASSDTLVLKTMLTVHPARLHVLCGSESPAANEHATGAQIKRLIEQLASQFSFIVVDTAAGLDEPTLAALEVTDDALMISTMDVSCVRGVRKEVELLTALGLLPESRTVVLNLADKQSGLKIKDIEAVVGLPVDVVIPRAPEVQLASNQGEPLILNKRKPGPFVRAITTVVARIVKQGQVSPSSKHRRLEVA